MASSTIHIVVKSGIITVGSDDHYQISNIDRLHTVTFSIIPPPDNRSGFDKFVEFAVDAARFGSRFVRTEGVLRILGYAGLTGVALLPMILCWWISVGIGEAVGGTAGTVAVFGVFLPLVATYVLLTAIICKRRTSEVGGDDLSALEAVVDQAEALQDWIVDTASRFGSPMATDDLFVEPEPPPSKVYFLIATMSSGLYSLFGSFEKEKVTEIERKIRDSIETGGTLNISETTIIAGDQIGNYGDGSINVNN